MKKILVCGAAGTIGKELVKYLLIEGKYEITALDLKNDNSYNKLKKYKKRINIVYGDVLDRPLMEGLIKDHDVIVYLATVLPPLSEYKKDLTSLVEIDGVENVIKAIGYYNPKCHLIYSSSSSVYNKPSKVKDEVKKEKIDYYSSSKLTSENLIKKRLNNYTIIRPALVLSDLRCDSFIYDVKKSEIECISKEDLAYAICSIINNISSLNRKTLNIGGGKSCRVSYDKLMLYILKYHGLSWKYVLTKIFGERFYDSYPLLDSSDNNKLLGYQNDSFESYFMRQKRRSKRRVFAKLLAKPFVFFKEKKLNKNVKETA